VGYQGTDLGMSQRRPHSSPPYRHPSLPPFFLFSLLLPYPFPHFPFPYTPFPYTQLEDLVERCKLLQRGSACIKRILCTVSLKNHHF